jgi:DNA polymerase elongation subunit (family B)
MTEMPEYNPETGTFGNYGQPNFADPIEEEIEVPPAVSNHPVLLALNEKVESLEKQLAEAERYRASNADQVRTLRYDHDSKKLKLKDVLVDFVEHNLLPYEDAKTIADIFDILLTKRIEIEYNITASVTIDVPITADPDDVADNLYCDRVDFSTYNEDHEVLETDFDVSDWNVRS